MVKLNHPEIPETELYVESLSDKKMDNLVIRLSIFNDLHKGSDYSPFIIQ